MSFDQDRLTFRMVLGPGKRARGRKVDAACSPNASDAAMAEIESCLPKGVLTNLPLGTYRFEVSAREGFRVVEFPVDAPADEIRASMDALFPVLRRLYIQLASIHDAMADVAAIDEAVDGMFASALNAVVEARKVAMLRPGFLSVEVGTNVGVFLRFYEKGLDPASIEIGQRFGYHVIPMEGTRFVGVVAVCQDDHPFAAYAVARFTSLFESKVRGRERNAVKSSQRSLEEELAELIEDRRLLAANFGELPPEERTDVTGYAEEVQRLSGAAGEA